jgi:hypothetical protein
MLLQYILKLSIGITVVYLFYLLLLRRLTFYTLNRWFLLAYSMICFIIPFIDVNVFNWFNRPALRQSILVQYIPVIEMTGNETAHTTIDPWQLVMITMVAGMLIMAVRLLVQYYSLFNMRRKAVLLYDKDVKLYDVNEQVIPFSFGNAIYINQRQHNEEELKDIIQHEFIHVKQRHSFDIIWSELLCIVNWYNPFAWLLKKDIRQNLEFIADQQVLQSGLDRKQYQYLLLKVVGVHSFSIATKFNFSSLKKRIAMMNKARTAKVHVLRFLFMLPLLVIILLAFRNTTRQHPVAAPAITAVADTIPNKAAGAAPVAPEDIQTIDINKTDNSQTVTIVLKNGQVEKYNLLNPKEKEVFEARYGPLPPAPPAPALPAVPAATAKPLIEKITRMDVDKAPQPPQPPAPPTLALARDTTITPDQIQRIDVNKAGNKITITLKTGEKNTYDLNDLKQKKDFESKYGKLPPPPPPVSPAPAPAPLPAPAGVEAPKPAAAPAPATPAVVANNAVVVIRPDDVKANAHVKTVLSNLVAAREETIAVISSATTEAQLAQIQQQLKEKGYTLELENVITVGGMLTELWGSISDPQGNKNGFAASDFSQVVISRTKTHKGAPTVLIVRVKSGKPAIS